MTFPIPVRKKAGAWDTDAPKPWMTTPGGPPVGPNIGKASDTPAPPVKVQLFNTLGTLVIGRGTLPPPCGGLTSAALNVLAWIW